MRLRLLGAAALAVTALAVPASAAPAVQFDRRCSGAVDSMCYYDFCGIVDCVRSDCLVYSGILGDGGNAGICVGPSRPREATE